MAVAAPGPLIRGDVNTPRGGAAHSATDGNDVYQGAARECAGPREEAERALGDPRATVRAAATVTFRASPDAALAHRARQVLRELLHGSTAERRAGLRAAIRLANPFSIPRLFGFLEHPDAETRRLTIAAIAVPHLGLLAPDLVRGRIEPLLSDPEAAVRAAARRALARMASTPPR